MAGKVVPIPTPVLDAARAYVGAGLSVLPVALDGSKGPAGEVLPRVKDPKNPDRFKGSWLPLRKRLPTDDELVKWFGGRLPFGIGVIGGAVSGGAECIDLDNRETADAFLKEVLAEDADLYMRLSLEQTPNGWHVWYRCPEVAGNTKLAQRTEPGGKVKTLIETRGEGGYAVVEGSPRAVHASGAPYRHTGGPVLADVREITPVERTFLFRTAMSFDRVDERHKAKTPPPSGPGKPGEPLSPGDDFDLRGLPFDEILDDAEFSDPGKDAGSVRRPGKEKGNSATVGHCRGKRGEPLLKVFTSNWPPFEQGKCYGRFQVLRLVRFGEDGSAATAWLRGKGFGTGPKPERNGTHPPKGEPAKPKEPPPWDTPVPLETGLKVPPFPLDALPGELAELVEAVAAATNSPADYAALPALAIAAGATGAALNFDVKAEYPEICSLYVCVVAPKGSGKTPALSYLMPPLVAEQARRRKAKDKTRAFVDNITVAKMAGMMQESGRGLLMIRDEISALFGGFDEFKAKGRGSDRQFYLSCASGASITVDRKDPLADPVFVAHPRLSVAGGIQPRVLSRFTADSDDGLFDRFLFGFPDPHPMAGENGLTVPAKLREAWAVAVAGLWAVEMPDDGDGPRPYYLKPTPDAWAAWVEWTTWLAAACNDEDFPEELRGPAAKLRGYAPRLAIVCHALRSVYGPRGLAREITGPDMAAGVRLAKYFFGHARRVWRASGREEGLRDARRVLCFARRWPDPAFSRRDLWRSLHGSFANPDALDAPVRLLIDAGYLRPADPNYAGTGRLGTPVYEKHPQLTDRAQK